MRKDLKQALHKCRKPNYQQRITYYRKITFFIHQINKNFCDSFDHGQSVEKQKQSSTTGRNVKLIWKKESIHVYSQLSYLLVGIHSDNRNLALGVCV